MIQSTFAIIGVAIASIHTGTYICDTWDAWNCFNSVHTLVRWSHNGRDVECMSLDGKACVKTPTIQECLKLKREPPLYASNLVCPVKLPSTKEFDWCIAAKIALKSLDETIIVPSEPKLTSTSPTPTAAKYPVTTVPNQYPTTKPKTPTPSKPTTTAPNHYPAPKPSTKAPYSTTTPVTTTPAHHTSPNPTTKTSHSTTKPVPTPAHYPSPKPSTTAPVNYPSPKPTIQSPHSTTPKSTTQAPHSTTKP
ncbi:hypothetical protein THRCLA_05550, partial [Thraustotheca clavata]